MLNLKYKNLTLLNSNTVDFVEGRGKIRCYCLRTISEKKYVIEILLP